MNFGKNKEIYIKALYEIIKYGFVAVFSALIDFGIFKVVIDYLTSYSPTKEIWVATIIARSVSSFVNYMLNKNFVFNGRKDVKGTIFSYYTLCIFQMICSGYFVGQLTVHLGIRAILSKLIVDCTIFMVNFVIQKLFIFKIKD